nr:hypothetical protein CFP56_49263 [Quercus suber]
MTNREWIQSKGEPLVMWLIVILKNLRSPVPKSNDLVCVALQRNGEGASESKICDLQNPPVLVDQQILGL